MTKGNDNDQSGWIAIQRTIASLVRKSRINDALDELNAFIASEGQPEKKSDALGYRAELRRMSGDLEGAKQDLSEAIDLVGPSYLRYVHELCLGDIYRDLRMIGNAITAYRTALQTCLETQGTSGGSALRAFLGLVPEGTLSSSDRALCAEVVRRSQELLGLENQPGSHDLKSAVSVIHQAEISPLHK